MIVSILGARPQFIKAAAVSRALSKAGVPEILVHTGQHFDENMSAVFFSELGIPQPAHNLGIGGGTHGQNTGRMVEAIERVLLDLKPDWVLVYGDTDSTLAAGLAAAKLHIRIAHVEAGLRSFNRRMPEEINRVLTDHLSTLLFAPTQVSIQNLEREGIANGHLVGDVMYDVARQYGEIADGLPGPIPALHSDFVLATVHRAENTNDRDRMAAIIEGFATSPLPVVFPVHPRTRKKLYADGLVLPPNVVALDPVGYLDMTWLERRAKLILTDSGGVQKEAYFHSVPCVTLRTETEWVELIEHGWNRLCPPVSARSINEAINTALESKPNPVSLYGDGKAAERIAAAFAEMTE